jgi:hypothetical protein
MSRTRRLPDGSRTASVDEYVEAWTGVARPVCERLGWALMSFDPHFTFTDGRGVSVEMTVGQVQDLAAALGGGNMSEINNLLAKIAEPETPEERDAAWNEVERRLRKMEEVIEVIDQAKKYPDPDPAGRTRRVIGYFKNEMILSHKRAEKAKANYPGELRKFYESVREEVDMRGNDCIAVFGEVRRRLSAEASDD